jgi:opacity protein-like surface antigen
MKPPAKRAALVFIAVLVAGAILVAGCEASVSTGGGGTTSYSNDQYGFSFEIADQFKEGDAASFSQSTGNAAFNVGFLDPNGAKSGGQIIDAFMTSVYVFKQEITPDLMPALKSELETALEQLKASDSSVEIQPLTETTVNGVPGYKTDYTMDMSGTPVQARTYFLVKGTTEYQISIQSSQANWSKNEPDLQKAVDSFKVK